MPAGPWIEPGDFSETVTFAQDDNPTYPVGPWDGELSFAANALRVAAVEELALDGTDYLTSMWAKLRGTSDQAAVDDIPYSRGDNPFGGPSVFWDVYLERNVRLDSTTRALRWGGILGNGAFHGGSPTLPPRAIDVEIDGVPEWTGTYTITYDFPTYHLEFEDPPSTDLDALAGGVFLLPFDASDPAAGTDPGHYPYAAITALSTMPDETLSFDESGFDVFPPVLMTPQQLMSSTTPGATNTNNVFRAQNVVIHLAYTVHFPRYRFIYPGNIPPRRLIGRDDSLVGVGRLHPRPSSRQSGRLTGYV